MRPGLRERIGAEEEEEEEEINLYWISSRTQRLPAQKIIGNPYNFGYPNNENLHLFSTKFIS